MPRVIKRYPNRKLYDVDARAFTSLSRLEALVRDGAEIQVVDNRSGADITGETLAKLLPTSAGSGRATDTSVLSTLIRTPGTVAQALAGHEDERDGLRRAADDVRSLSRTVDALLDAGRDRS